MPTLLELLTPRGLTSTPQRTKLVRHRGDQLDMNVLHREGWLETYQSLQDKPIFDGCDTIVSFIGEAGAASRFIGVYTVGTRSPASAEHLPDGCPYPQWLQSSSTHYAMHKCTGFEDLEGRMVIDWGKAALAWHQWLTDRPVLELRPRGRELAPFRDYLRVHLSFRELQVLATQQAAHPDWIAGLSAVGAIYLIVDTRTGAQYVGSATGTGGLWQRWTEYASTGHGGNLRLKERCSAMDGCPQSFQFSILDTFSRSLAPKEALALETFFKYKLGSRSFGLNAN